MRTNPLSCPVPAGWSFFPMYSLPTPVVKACIAISSSVCVASLPGPDGRTPRKWNEHPRGNCRNASLLPSGQRVDVGQSKTLKFCMPSEKGHVHRASQDCTVRPDQIAAGLRRLLTNTPHIAHEPRDRSCTSAARDKGISVMPARRLPLPSNSPGRAAAMFPEIQRLCMSVARGRTRCGANNSSYWCPPPTKPSKCQI
jgi:hypothetical protein